MFGYNIKEKNSNDDLHCMKNISIIQLKKKKKKKKKTLNCNTKKK